VIASARLGNRLGADNAGANPGGFPIARSAPAVHPDCHLLLIKKGSSQMPPASVTERTAPLSYVSEKCSSAGRFTRGVRRLRSLISAVVIALGGIAIWGVGPAAAASTNDRSWSFVSNPGLHPPVISITNRTRVPRHNYVFVAPTNATTPQVPVTGQYGPLILDPRGNPVWQRPLATGLQAMNVRPQIYRGRSVLTWWQGTVSHSGTGSGEDMIVDHSYRTIAVVRGANGLKPDLHEFKITRRGTALITAYRQVTRDLTPYGGARDGQVLDPIVQEIDIKTGRLLFQWDALAHISLSDSYVPVNGAPGPWDSIHVNSIDTNASGQLLISARNTSTVYLVGRRTGAIIWRLGGKHTDFTQERGASFAFQHDVEFEPGGRISMFEDESSPAPNPPSRALILTVDLRHRTAAVAAQYSQPPRTADSQGSAEMAPRCYPTAPCSSAGARNRTSPKSPPPDGWCTRDASPTPTRHTASTSLRGSAIQ
jgi:hypothetical protein